MSKTVKFRPESNPDRVEWVLLRRSSNVQNKAQRRQRTRGAVRLHLRKEAMA